MLQSRKFISFIILAAILNSPVFVVYALEIEGTFTGIVDKVVDGDTFYVTLKNGTSYSVRLADLNAEEIGQAGYQEAKDLLASLVYGKIVYLDVDDVYIWDFYGEGSRLVCVVYVEYNTTHLLNVNKALIDSKIVEVKDYENEFSPYTWSLYMSKESILEFPYFTYLCAVTVVIIAAILLIYVGATRKSVWKRRKPIFYI